MALQTSGAISLNQIHIEAGGSSGTSVTINDADIRGLNAASGYTIPTGSGTTIDFGDFYGASSSHTVTEGSASSGGTSQYGYNNQGSGTFGSISPTTWSSANILQLFTLTIVVKGSTSYSLMLTFSGNQSTSFFSSVSIGGVSHAMSTFTRNYASPNTYFSKALTSSQVMDGSGTTTVIFT